MEFGSWKGTLIASWMQLFRGRLLSTKEPLRSHRLIISGFVNGKVDADNIIIMENGKISGDITYNQLAVFEGGIIQVAGMKRREKQKDDKIIDIANSNQK